MALGNYRIVSFQGAVGEGVAGTQFVHIDAVAKANSSQAPYCLCNELICAQIGRFLGLPIPPIAIVESKATATMSGLWFTSLNFNSAGLPLPPVNPSACIASLPDESAGLVLFDILIANSDRHRKNFALDVSKPVQMTIFDHSHAFFGNQANQGVSRLKAMEGRLGITGAAPTHGNRHCLLDLLSSNNHFTKWIDRIGKIPDFFIDDLCKDIVSIGASSEEAKEAKRFLASRRDNFKKIIEDHKDEFKGITAWRML